MQSSVTSFLVKVPELADSCCAVGRYIYTLSSVIVHIIITIPAWPETVGMWRKPVPLLYSCSKVTLPSSRAEGVVQPSHVNHIDIGTGRLSHYSITKLFISLSCRLLCSIPYISLTSNIFEFLRSLSTSAVTCGPKKKKEFEGRTIVPGHNAYATLPDTILDFLQGF